MLAANVSLHDVSEENELLITLAARLPSLPVVSHSIIISLSVFINFSNPHRLGNVLNQR